LLNHPDGSGFIDFPGGLRQVAGICFSIFLSFLLAFKPQSWGHCHKKYRIKLKKTAEFARRIIFFSTFAVIKMQLKIQILKFKS